ncbi:CPBP family intramembrane glutamic endopeptidase [Pseudochryseolinea flava]|uniref:CPBP family intramembrane metalloprotease n=1 Tax=Pseudochryseolinea flava TaxID=2059302 RepID=A0A364Y4X0_9BACT|nr:type II CAAX endopeptidase family protein [Pseudochryseolinea flava]RAW01826.1 CPBP family intramembrane metalloprotease [Pseudochryseolinea flava]
MIGILVILLISSIILYAVERKTILVLGFTPALRAVKYFLIGFTLLATLCAAVQLLTIWSAAGQWSINDAILISRILRMLSWDATSVLTEELIFRGALLYLLIRWIGSSKAVLISAIAFGVYHWFSFGILGYVVPMIVVFIGTGLMGYAWALSYAKTGSIALAFGMHLGWNFTHNTIFSKGPLGDGLLLIRVEEVVSSWISLIGLCGIPILVVLVVQFWIKDERRKDEFIEKNRS